MNKESNKTVELNAKINPIQDEKSSNAKKQGKLSYEELNQALMDISQQNQTLQQYVAKLQNKVQEMNMILQIRRMDYLFEVLKNSNVFSEYDHKDFVESCIEEIIASFTAEPNEENEEQK